MINAINQRTQSNNKVAKTSHKSPRMFEHTKHQEQMNYTRNTLALISLLLLLIGCNNTVHQTSTIEVERTEHDELIAEIIARHLATNEWIMIDANSMIVELYNTNSNLPVWSSDGALTAQSLAFIETLNNSRAYGLEPSYYTCHALNAISDSLFEISNDEIRHQLLAEVDLLLTNAYFHFATDIRHGILNEETLEHVWKKELLEVNLVTTLAESMNSETLISTLLALQPNNTFYTDLQLALSLFVETHDLDFMPQEVPNFRDDSLESYALAQQILLANGYLDSSLVNEDSALFNAIELFQIHHGLNADGLIGTNTALALSMSNMQRYHNAATTLERWRWNNAPEGDHLFANIPGFHVMAIENGQIALDLHVIVGTTWNQTPELVDEMEYMEVYPFWYVPKSIAVGEILPKVKTDSTYLASRGFKVLDKNRNIVNPDNIDWANLNAGNFDYRFRKDGGYTNDLGFIKFMFPNENNVYMHDTPNRALFENDIRAYSHGCVRVQDPFALADYLLEKDEHVMTRDSLDTFVANKQRTVVTLSINVPVYIGYYTCEADKDFNLYFFSDIYGRNEPLVQSMFGLQNQPIQ